MRKRSVRAVIVLAAGGVLSIGSAASAVGVAASNVNPSNWYRADALLGLDSSGNPNALPADGTFFSKWFDVSGNGKDTGQLTTARRPTFRANAAGATNTLPAVRFNLNSDVGGVSGSGATEFIYFNGNIANTADSKLTMFVVSKDSGSRSTNAVRSAMVSTRSNGTGGGLVLGDGTVPTTASYFHSGHTTSTGAATQTLSEEGSDFTLTALNRDAFVTTLSRFSNLGSDSTTTTWGGNHTVNGTTYTGFTPSALALANGTPVTQIGTENGSSYFFGDIAEILIYDGSALGARDTKIVTNYLGEKYGIASADLPELNGDANVDFKVDFSDLVTLAQHYNQSTGQTRSTGDFNGDGAVNFGDLVLLAQNYNVGVGTVVMPAGASAQFKSDFALAQSLVPEPTTAAALASLCFLRVRRRRR